MIAITCVEVKGMWTARIHWVNNGRLELIKEPKFEGRTYSSAVTAAAEFIELYPDS